MLWVLTLYLPALELAGGRTVAGLELLRQAWQGVRFGVIAWFANPLFVLAVAMAAVRRFGAATICSAAAAIAAATSLTAHATAVSAGAPVPEFGFAVGFYLWFGIKLSLFTSCLAAFICRRGGLGGRSGAAAGHAGIDRPGRPP